MLDLLQDLAQIWHSWTWTNILTVLKSCDATSLPTANSFNLLYKACLQSHLRHWQTTQHTTTVVIRFPSQLGYILLIEDTKWVDFVHSHLHHPIATQGSISKSIIEKSKSRISWCCYQSLAVSLLALCLQANLCLASSNQCKTANPRFKIPVWTSVPVKLAHKGLVHETWRKQKQHWQFHHISRWCRTPRSTDYSATKAHTRVRMPPLLPTMEAPASVMLELMHRFLLIIHDNLPYGISWCCCQSPAVPLLCFVLAYHRMFCIFQSIQATNPRFKILIRIGVSVQ